jgi:iron complex transport system substrate-binding protein
MTPHGPQRIVCLSAEAADWLWRIGAWDQVAGITAFFEAPSEAAKRPRISGFSTADLDRIEQLHPDLVITFSDVQASLTAELIKRGIPVLATNQRTLAEIEDTLRWLARTVGREAQGESLLAHFRERTAPLTPTRKRLRVYFEEWNDPLVTGICWVSELIERAGGTDIFVESRLKRAARDRVVSSAQVQAAVPDIIFASWCGKPVIVAEIASRLGWENIPAVRTGRIYEVPAHEILQPGFRLIEGFDRLKALLAKQADKRPPA